LGEDLQQIGLYVHRIRVFEDYNRQELGRDAGQFNLRQVIGEFVAFHERNFMETDERMAKLAEVVYSDDTTSGIIRYGTTGLASDIVDAETDELKLRRERTDIEYIPLYFCFYVPDGEDTWYVATQSFGGRSFSSTFNTTFRDFAEHRTNRSVTVQKVMPTSQADMARKPVQKITMIKRHVPPEGFSNQVGDLAKELKMSLSVSLDGRGALGFYEEVRDRIAEKQAVALVYEGIEFEEMQATVKIGSSYRTVSLVGVNNTAGVVDVSGLVERNEDEYPVFESIHEVATDVLRDYMIEYRDQ
jgi:hypothetical protein